MKNQLSKITLTLSLLLVASITFGQGQQPQTGKQSIHQLKGSPAGSKVVALMKAINGEGEAVNEAFVKKYFSPGNIERNGVDRLITIISKDIARNDGKVTVYEANRQSMFEYKLLVKGSNQGNWMEFTFKIEPNQPYRVDGLMLRAGIEPPAGDLKAMALN